MLVEYYHHDDHFHHFLPWTLLVFVDSAKIFSAVQCAKCQSITYELTAFPPTPASGIGDRHPISYIAEISEQMRLICQ